MRYVTVLWYIVVCDWLSNVYCSIAFQYFSMAYPFLPFFSVSLPLVTQSSDPYRQALDARSRHETKAERLERLAQGVGPSKSLHPSAIHASSALGTTAGAGGAVAGAGAGAAGGGHLEGGTTAASLAESEFLIFHWRHAARRLRAQNAEQVKQLKDAALQLQERAEEIAREVRYRKCVEYMSCTDCCCYRVSWFAFPQVLF